MATDPSLGANPNHGANASHGVSLSLGTEAARGMRERAEARKLARQQHEAAEKAATPEGELLAKIRELQYRCLKLEARNPADLLPRSFRLAVAGGAGGLGDHPFKVIDASEAGVPKVRVLPGLVNTGFATCAGMANDQISAADHLANAPRLTLTDNATNYIVVAFTGVSGSGPYPATADIQANTVGGAINTMSEVIVAIVVTSGGKITQIRQERFDAICCAAIDLGGTSGVVFSLS